MQRNRTLENHRMQDTRPIKRIWRKREVHFWHWTSNGIHQFELGSEVTFKTMINDADGNRCYNEQDLLDVEFQSPSGKVARHKIAPRKDGEYSVTYKPDYVGKHEVLIAVNGEPLTGSPWSVHVMPHP